MRFFFHNNYGFIGKKIVKLLFSIKKKEIENKVQLMLKKLIPVH